MAGCPPQTGEVPGSDKTLKDKLTDVATSTLQSFAPLKGIHQHVCAFHIYSHDATRQVRAHHFCSHVNKDFRQCVIYDSDKADARLIGIEYIISKKLYDGLPEDEKKYWHSHVYEVTSGMLIAPNIPEAAAQLEMEELVNTYGKTWHTWQVDRGDPLPLGPPQLMMAIVADKQLAPEALAERDAMYHIETADIRAKRQHIQPSPPTPDPGADHCWRMNQAWQVDMKLGPFTATEEQVQAARDAQLSTLMSFSA